MEHLPQIIIDLALLLAVAGVTTLICKWLKQPLVLGYVVAGFLISPAISFVPSIGDTESVETWSELGVIFLMFGLGLEFSIMKLTTIGKAAITTALVEMGLMIALGFGVGSLLGWDFWTCIFLGGMLAISSTTIIIKTFDELGLKGKKFTDLVFGALVMEDIVGIFIMVILSTVAVGSAIDGGAVAGQLGEMILYLVIWFVLSLILIPTFLKKVSKGLTDEIVLIIAIALCLIMVVIANALGFSTALGAFIAGSILAGTVQAHRIEKLFKPIKDLFGAVFFVSVGMLVSPQAIIDNWVGILVVTIATLIGKPIASTLGAFAAGKNLKESLHVGLSLSQIGEFSFIIAALGVTLGVTADFLYPLIVTVSVVTTLTTPFYIKSADKVYEIITKILPDSLVNRLDNRKESTSDAKESSHWSNYLKAWFFKVLMVFVASLATVVLLGGLLKPLMLLAIPADITDHILTVLSLIITGIFISNLFQSSRKGDFGKLWTENQKHHVPLMLILVVSFLLSIASIVYIVTVFEGGSLLWIIPAIIITLLFARSKHLHSWFIQLENLFVGNLNEQILHERNADNSVTDRIQWTEDHLFVTEVKVTKFNERRGKPVPVAYYIARTCNLDLIKIKRDGISMYEDELAHLTKDGLLQSLADPEDRMTLEKKDILTFLGTEEEIEAFQNNMINAGALSEDDKWMESLQDYLEDEPECGDLMCFSLRIDSVSDFKNKTIDSINFRENYGCMVLALERNLLPVIKPSRNTRLFQKDLILLMGTREMAEFFKETTTEAVISPAQIANPETVAATP